MNIVCLALGLGDGTLRWPTVVPSSSGLASGSSHVILFVDSTYSVLSFIVSNIALGHGIVAPESEPDFIVHPS